MEHTRTRTDLKNLQELPLARKVGFTAARIIEFYNATKGQCYISCSLGKDSLVLLRIARELYPSIPAVFCDTGLEYPEVKEMLKVYENITCIRPTVSFKKVISEFGFPVIGKEVAKTVYQARKGQKDAIAKLAGTRVDKKTGKPSQFNIPQHQHLLSAPFKISHLCCDYLKKKPFYAYEKATGRAPIVATMAYESVMRRVQWIKRGCNIFEAKRKMSTPMSFWLEQDVLEYLRLKEIQIPQVYGEIQNVDGKLKLTGVQRTGCIFCLFGLKFDGQYDRFHRLADTHPELFKYCMESLGLRPVVEYIRNLKKVI